MTAGLDATPEGRAVYRRLGFRDAGAIRRFEAGEPAPAPAPDPIPLRPCVPGDLEAVAALDGARQYWPGWPMAGAGASRVSCSDGLACARPGSDRSSPRPRRWRAHCSRPRSRGSGGRP